MPSYGSLATAVMALLSAAPAMAHFAMLKPTPIAGTNDKSPLLPSGENFPCQGVSKIVGYSGTYQPLKAGEDMPLEFDIGGGANWAVHGGGSCQISVLYDVTAEAAVKPENWKVIYTIQGGCPSNAAANLNPTATECTTNGGECVNKFSIPIPKEVKDGKAIVGWSWFNRIGQREMYMNCAAVEFSGGSGKMESLPGMFTANLLKFNTCKTADSADVDIPNPGKFLLKQSTTGLVPPTGECGASSGGSAPAAGDSSSAAGDSATATSAPPAGDSATATSAPPAGDSAAATSAPAGDAASTPAAGSSSAASTDPAAPSQTAPPTDGAAGGTSCPVNGAVVCQGTTKFGLCNNGSVVFQDVAAGTACTNGRVRRIR